MAETSDAGRLKSPPFPSISLQRAIERAEQLYRQERDHLAPISSAARAWSMSPTSSGPVKVVGALKQFNLIEDDGAGEARKIRLTKDALRIILDKQANSGERDEAIRRCFTSPKIFADLWGKWGSELPSEQTMVNHLILERRLSNLAPFSDQGALELLGNYRSSMAFLMSLASYNAPSLSDNIEREPDMQPEKNVEAKIFAVTPASVARVLAQTLPNSAERVVFIEEGEPGQYIKLVASGDLDETLLEALEDYVKRLKKRLIKTLV